MVLTTTPAGELGHAAPDFSLADTSGEVWSRDAVCGENGLVVAFICNHCPYVIAVIDRLVDDALELEEHGIGTVAIMSNDWQAYPADAPDKMAEFAEDHGLPFHYLVDPTQEVARSYGAVCTPDLFGYDRDLRLAYRGRLDSAANRPARSDTVRELRDAMIMIAETGKGPDIQNPSIGCSIKWR